MADLVAPIVPVPDSSSLQYVAKGLSAMVANRQHQQAYELAYQKMIQDAALDQAKFMEARKEFALDYGIKQQQLNIAAGLARDRGDYYKAAGKAKMKGLQLVNDWNVGLANQQKDAMEAFDKTYNLNDADEMTNNPVGYALNARKWTEEWGNSPNQQIQRNISMLKGRVAPLSISIPQEVIEDTSLGVTTLKGKGSNKVSVLDVIEKLKDPAQQDRMMQLLQAGGYTKSEQVPLSPEIPGQKSRALFGGGGSTKGVKPSPPATTETRTTLQSPLANYMEQGKTLDFGHRPSLVPEMFAPSSATNKGTGEMRQQIQEQVFDNDVETDDALNPPDASAAPASGATPLRFAPTAEDSVIASAKLALAHGAPLPALAVRLRNMGIDPSRLYNDVSTLPPSAQFSPAVQAA